MPFTAEGGTDADGDVFRRSEKPVDQDPHKRRVETELWLQLCQEGIGHRLGNHDTAHGDAYSPTVSVVRGKDWRPTARMTHPQSDLRRATEYYNE